MAATRDRFEVLQTWAPRNAKCLEVAPFFRPALVKPHFDVDYTDYATTEELRAKVPTHEGIDVSSVCEVDYVWRPEKPLRACIPNNIQYDFVIASHVMEHVPDVLGWTQQLLDVMRPGAVLQLALPDHRGCFDVFRQPTQFSEMLQNWITVNDRPNVGQIFDFLSRNVAMPPEDGTKDFSSFPFGDDPKLKDFSRNYDDASALHFALHHFKHGTYMDTHCSVFTPESFVECFSMASKLGILNVEVSQTTVGEREFFVSMRKQGEPRVRREAIFAEKKALAMPAAVSPPPTNSNALIKRLARTFRPAATA